MTPELIAQYRKRYENLASLENMGFWAADDVHDDIHKFLDALESALSQAEANRVDAERYRWLRNFASPRQKPAPEDMPLSYYPVLLRCDTAVYSPATWGNDVDRLVDAARLTNAVKTKD